MGAQDPPTLLTSLTDLGRRTFGAAACSLAVLEDDDEHLRFRAASGAGAEEVLGLRLPVSRGIAGWVVSSGQPIVVSDVRADPRFAVDVAESTGYVPQVILAAPLTAGGEPLGVVEVLDPDSGLGDGSLELLAALAAHAALAVAATAATPATDRPDPRVLLAELLRRGPDEERAAGDLLLALHGYLGRSGGPAGLV
ncbi:GAF domain-containing protein [Geodermatophilus sp. SYSU D01106]